MRRAYPAAIAAGLIAAAAPAAQPDGAVTISQVQLALLVSGNVGGGMLSYNGETLAFSIGGLGVGGVGASRVEAEGEV
jgi:hypothetical protein